MPTRPCPRDEFTPTVRATFPACTPRPGLQALDRQARRHVTVADPRRLLGSVNLDACYAAREPQAPRWDYLIGWCTLHDARRQIYFLEVHPAKEHEIKRIVAKKQWLLAKMRGKPLTQWPHFFCWVAPQRTAFLRHGPVQQRLAQKGILFVGNRLHIPRSCA